MTDCGFTIGLSSLRKRLFSQTPNHAGACFQTHNPQLPKSKKAGNADLFTSDAAAYPTSDQMIAEIEIVPITTTKMLLRAPL